MTIHSIDSIKDAAALKSTLSQGERVSTLSYFPPVFPSAEFVGGRVYVWDPDRPTADHDGGTYISLTCTWDGTHANLEDFLDGVGETNPTGTGCLVLQDIGEVNVEDYGAKGNDQEDANTVDDFPSIQAAINRVVWQDGPTKIFSGRVKLRSTQYYVSQTINLKSEVKFEGMGHSSVMRFPSDTTGIIVNRDDTINDTTVSPETGDAAGSVLRNFTVDSNYGSDTSKHGIWMRRAIMIEGVRATRFAGHGIAIIATAVTQDQSRVGNANGWFLLNVHCSLNKRHGVYVDGADVNAGWGIGVDCAKNEGVGIFDSSFLGNTWVGCHVATNDEGSYEADNNNARSLFLGCYSEGGKPASNLVAPSLAIGGLHAAGLNGYYMDGDDLTIRDVFAKRQVHVERHGLDFMEHVVAHNSNGRGVNDWEPHDRYEAGFVGYSAYKVDGSPRPSGAIAFRPQGTDRDEQTVIEFYVYDGDGTDSMVKVAHFWGNTDFTPETDNVTQMGWSGDAWRTLYLNHGVLTPSESADLTNVESLSAAELAVATALKGLVKKFNRAGSSVKHVGVVAEDVEAAFTAQSLNAYDYGVLEDIQRKHVRYDELFAFIIAAL